MRGLFQRIAFKGEECFVNNIVSFIGILSGTSAMLLTFDEGEVRKIVAVCRGVIKYLSQVAELVDRMEDLITFVKNLSPGVTNMAKQVEARAKELTHVAHAEILEQRVASVKKIIPSLISSIKAFVTTGAGKALLSIELNMYLDGYLKINHACTCTSQMLLKQGILALLASNLGRREHSSRAQLNGLVVFLLAFLQGNHPFLLEALALSFSQ